LLNLKTKANK